MAILALAANSALDPSVQACSVVRGRSKRPFSARAVPGGEYQEDLAELQSKLGHDFSDLGLLRIALTHQSWVETQDSEGQSYQRLEFLGDRVLGLAVSDVLFRAQPEVIVGKLSRRLSDLVRWETCAEIADEWNLARHIRFAPNIGADTRQSRSVMADVCEAVLGAIYLDGGYVAAQVVVKRFWQPHIAENARPMQDPKTALQEWAQGRSLPPPTYSEVRRSGPDHEPNFVVAVEVPGFALSHGEANSKKYAQQSAAQAFLLREGIWNSKS